MRSVENIHLFTIFCRYEEQVRISQLKAPNAATAVGAWVSTELRELDIPEEHVSRLAQELIADRVSPIQECVNAWVVTAFPIWLDIVATLPGEESP